MEFPFLILWEELGIKTSTRKTVKLEPLYNYKSIIKYTKCVCTCVYAYVHSYFNTSDLTVKLRSTTSVSPPPDKVLVTGDGKRARCPHLLRTLEKKHVRKLKLRNFSGFSKLLAFLLCVNYEIIRSTGRTKYSYCVL